MGKLVRLILGPIHFETRFKPFLESNKNTLSNFIFLVDNYELYKPYIDLVEIVDINKLIENHPWSKDKEYIFSEKDPQKFIENYYEVCSKNYCSANIIRLVFLYLYEKNILNFDIITNNFLIVDDQEKINSRFNSKVSGEFSALKLLSENGILFSMSSAIKDEIQKQLPNLKIPETYYYFDGYATGFNFKTKEDLLLFYNIWDTLSKIYVEDFNSYKYFYSNNHSMICWDAFIGYSMSIFNENMDYSYKNMFTETDGLLSMGTRVSIPHDTWYCSPNRVTLFRDSNFDMNKNVKTISDFIKLNKNKLEHFYSQYEKLFDIDITDDNITFKYKIL